jgi:hypothetical protein
MPPQRIPSRPQTTSIEASAHGNSEAAESLLPQVIPARRSAILQTE